MGNIIFWTGLVLLPVMIGTAYAWFHNFHHEDDF